MGWFSRKFGRKGPNRPAMVLRRSSIDPDRREHLLNFVQTRREVEAFVEPPTTVNRVTILLVARNGEWTRRQVPDVDAAFDFAHDAGIPAYDVNQSGYPQAMRDYNARQKAAKKRLEQE